MENVVATQRGLEMIDKKPPDTLDNWSSHGIFESILNLPPISARHERSPVEWRQMFRG